MSDTVNKNDHELVFGLKVMARANGVSEELYFLDFDAGFAQYGILKAAGYKDVILIPTYFIHDDDKEWRPISIGLAVAITDQPKAARYTRADINPGISLRRYEREVLKRPRATTVELYCVAVVTILLAASLVYPLVKLTVVIATALQFEEWMIFLLVTMMACTLVPALGRLVNATTHIAEKIVGVPSVKEWNDK